MDLCAWFSLFVQLLKGGISKARSNGVILGLAQGGFKIKER